jgi:hypothetical protein
MLDQALLPVYRWLRDTPLSHFVQTSQWTWPICESLHFIGLSMLIGTVGLFDLRLLGFARGVPLTAFHRLIPIGVVGFVINLITGILFVAGTPEQFLFNPAFRLKVLFILFAGVNISVFYLVVFRQIKGLGPGDMPPMAARIIGGISLSLWIGVMSAGRLLTFFRPFRLPVPGP